MCSTRVLRLRLMEFSCIYNISNLDPANIMYVGPLWLGQPLLIIGNIADVGSMLSGPCRLNRHTSCRLCPRGNF